MDIHKPKPIRNWREFLKEYAIIVIGVLTALAAEQAAETWHAHSRAEKARAEIRVEIAGNLRLMNLRAATETCIAKRLDEVSGLIAASSAGKLLKEDIWIGRPSSYALPDGRYKAAVQSGAVSLFEDKEQSGYAWLYNFFGTYYILELKEQEAWADLRMLEDQPPPSPELDVRLRSAFKQVKLNRYIIQRLQNLITRTNVGEGSVAPRPLGKLEAQSICLPLHTPRAQAVKTITADREAGGAYDEP